MKAWLLTALAAVPCYSLVPPSVPWWHRATVALAIASQLLPLFSLLEQPRPVPQARRWVAIWGAIYLLSDVLQPIIARASGNNQWFIQWANPVEDAALLMAFSAWQLRPVLRLTFRLAIPLLALVTIAIAWRVDEIGTFKAVSSPFRLLLLSSAVAWTLVSRSAVAVDRIWRQDWFWVSLGVVLHFSASVLVDPISSRLYPTRPDLVFTIYFLKASVDVLAFALIYVGMRCPTHATSSTSMSVDFSRSG